jgi:hypothetical protein
MERVGVALAVFEGVPFENDTARVSVGLTDLMEDVGDADVVGE